MLRATCRSGTSSASMRFLEDAYLTDVLKSLIVQSSLPLRTVEHTFAVDSSGFSTSRFDKWFDEKYGVTRHGHIWVKAHLAVGTTTHVITAVEILDRDAGDSLTFRPLVKSTAELFHIAEVAADKAYSSVANLETVADLGGTPYVIFNENAVPARGGLWEKMLGYYQYRRDEFLAHYHRRSNVGSVFSMVEAKFRDHVRSRKDTAMVNEVLCKFLCHNICVAIQSQCELGIEPVFWGNVLEGNANVVEPAGKSVLSETEPYEFCI